MTIQHACRDDVQAIQVSPDDCLDARLQSGGGKVVSATTTELPRYLSLIVQPSVGFYRNFPGYQTT